MRYTYKNGKKLKYGYTTGSCAAAATKAAAIMLLGQKKISSVELLTPKGWLLNLEIKNIVLKEEIAVCGIEKDSGDDPDITNGMMLLASVRLSDTDRVIGGEGVGIVRKKGLAVGVGLPAINPVPMKMILKVIDEIKSYYHYAGGLEVELIIPDGLELSKKTFNPRLGIEGGLSILGTTGIVEPMSEEAFKESLFIELKQLKQKAIVFAPGNYGRDYCKTIGIDENKIIKISNFVGYMFEKACELGIEKILFVGHIGKLIKVSGGIFHTHSRVSDGRMPILCSHLLETDITVDELRLIKGANTTDEAVDMIMDYGYQAVFDEIVRHIKDRLELFVFNQLSVEVVLFSSEHGVLSETQDAHVLKEALSE